MSQGTRWKPNQHLITRSPRVVRINAMGTSNTAPSGLVASPLLHSVSFVRVDGINRTIIGGTSAGQDQSTPHGVTRDPSLPLGRLNAVVGQISTCAIGHHSLAVFSWYAMPK